MSFQKLYTVSNISSRDSVVLPHEIIEKISQLIKNTGCLYEFFLQKNRLYIKRSEKQALLVSSYHSSTKKCIMSYIHFYVEIRELLDCIQFFYQWYLSKTDPSFL